VVSLNTMLNPLVIGSNWFSPLTELISYPASALPLHPFLSGLVQTSYWSRPRLDNNSGKAGMDSGSVRYIVVGVWLF